MIIRFCVDHGWRKIVLVAEEEIDGITYGFLDMVDSLTYETADKWVNEVAPNVFARKRRLLEDEKVREVGRTE